MVRNPFYPTNVTRYKLDPKLVDVIGFCTKNPRPMFKYLDDISKYDVIFIGSPIYWGTMPQPLFTELEMLDFNNKIIMPFTTHEGSGLAILGSDVKNSKRLIENWINDNL